MKILALIISVVIVANNVIAQSSFVPQNLGSAINSSYDEINPVISDDAKTLYFTRVNHPENTFGARDSEDIWMSTLQADGTWSTAIRATPLNIGRYNAVLSISPDGNTVLLNGVYNKGGNIWKKRGLSTATRLGDAWSTPEKLKVRKLARKNRGMKSSASMSADGNHIVFSYSRVYNSNKTNLFISEKNKNGKWKRPRAIGELNTRFNEDAPFISEDNKTLYFASDRKAKGEYNIYKSNWDLVEDNGWSEPIILSDTVNSVDWESYFKTNHKGSWAYYSSTHNASGGADIFKVKIFEENPFVVVSGQVRNSESNRLLKDKPFRILVNGEPATDFSVSRDSATYSVKLPLNHKYSIAVETPNFIGIPEAVDVTGIREFTKLDRALMVQPLPYVLVKGKLLVQGSSEKIPAVADSKIRLGNSVVDSAKISLAQGTYSLKLKRGSVHNLNVLAKRFESIPHTVDLGKVDEYSEMEIDLYASAIKMALITGRVVDKKTNKPLEASQRAEINVEGLENIFSSIDPVTGYYELRLPLGNRYVINASAPDYFPVYENIDVVNEKGDIKIYKDLIIVPIEIGQSVRLNNIFFETGKSVLKKESFPELDRVIDFLNQNAEIKVEIGGHTDNVGKAASNLKLSQARAKAVATYITAKGIAKDRILSKGYGLTKPVASNATKEGKAQNRRVEFTILDK